MTNELWLQGWWLLVFAFLLSNASGLSLVDSRCYRPQSGSSSSDVTTGGPSVICENLGVLAQVPDFPSSSYNGTYELLIRNGTTIFLIQAAAFASCGVRRLILVGLGVTLVDQRAFVGLESTLEYLDVGSNEISKLHPDTFVGLEKLNVLDLDGNRIYFLPEGLLATPRSLDTIDLRRNKITSLASPSGLFKRQVYLQTLLLGGNTLGAFDNTTFEGLRELRTMDLSGNDLKNVDYSTFRSVGHLMNLGLRENKLTRIPATICQYIQYLVDLDLSSNEIANLSEASFSGCPALKFLNISGNNLTSLPDRSIEILHELNTLDLSGNNLTTFPWTQLQNLRLLARLNLSRNSLSNPPSGAFFYNDNLRSLNLSSNLLTSLTFGMFSSSNSIETLDLSQNELTFTDLVSLQSLVRTKYLYLSGNRMEGVVPGLAFQTLASLEQLDLRFNQISQVGRDSFSFLLQLKQLQLDHNMIATIADDAFIANFILSILSLNDNRLQDLSRLRSNSIRVLHADSNNVTFLPPAEALDELHLRDNQITTIPPTFTSSRLKLLDLVDNRLEVLSITDLVSSCPFLERLILRGNGIREIQGGTLLVASSLVELDLSENCLSTLKYDSIQGVTKSLQRFSIDQNPILCSCEVSWLRSYAPLINRNVTVCYFANGTSNRWTDLTCNSVINCPDADQSVDSSTYDAACSRSPLLASSTLPACFPGFPNSSSTTPWTKKAPYFAAVSKPSEIPTYAYILIPIIGCALTITIAALLLTRWRRKRSKIPIQNGPPSLRTLPRQSVPFESFKIPNGNGVGRPTNFQLNTLHVRNAVAVRRFGQRYLDGVRGMNRES